MLKPSVDLKMRVVGGQKRVVDSEVAVQRCAGSWETTLPIESRLVDSCKGRNSRSWWWCFPVAKLWDGTSAELVEAVR